MALLGTSPTAENPRTAAGNPIVGQAVPRTDPAAGGAGGGGAAFTPSASFGSLAQGVRVGGVGAIGDPTIDPGFEWRRNQGQKGLERASAAKGTLMTGGSLADIMDYNQGLASQEYANAWDRAYRKWMGEANIAQGNASIDTQNRGLTIGAYQGLINSGLNAANSYMGTVGNAASAGANAQAGAQAGSGSAWGNAARDAGNAAGNAWMWNYDRFGTPQVGGKDVVDFNRPGQGIPITGLPTGTPVSDGTVWMNPPPYTGGVPGSGQHG